MGQIENLVEWWIETNKLPFGYEGVESITKKLQSYIEICETLPSKNRIKGLSFLYDKCDYILNSIASFMNYQLEYEPTDDEIWDFIEQERKSTGVKSEDLLYWKYFISEDNIEDFVSFDESTLYEHVIGPMRKQYKEKNKDASEWCDKIQEIQTDIYKRISKEKEKEKFLEEVFASKDKIVKTTIEECLVNCNAKEVKTKLVSLLKGKKGDSVAAVIFALNKLKYISEEIKPLFHILESEFNITGGYPGVTSGIRKMENYEKDIEKNNKPNMNEKKLYDKMEAIKKHLKQ